MSILENYSTYIILAGLVSVSGIYFSAVKNGFNKRFITIFIVLTLFSTFIGARLLNFITNRQDYLDGKISLLTFNFQGFSLYGGLSLSLLVGFLICKKFKINLLRLSDISMPFIGIGIAIVRIGCFIHGCCFGKKPIHFLGFIPNYFLRHIFSKLIMEETLFCHHIKFTQLKFTKCWELCFLV